MKANIWARAEEDAALQNLPQLPSNLSSSLPSSSASSSTLFLEVQLRRGSAATMQCCDNINKSSDRPTLAHSISKHSDKMERLAGESAVVVFSLSSCCLCHVVKRLLCSLGVNPTVHEVDDDEELKKALMRGALDEEEGHHGSHYGSSTNIDVPAVFVGGKLLGGLDKVMAAHINGSLVPLLREAGALWL